MECRDRKPETILEDVEKYDFNNRENLDPNGQTPSTKNETPNRYPTLHFQVIFNGF